MAIIREEISNSDLEQLLPPVAINANKDNIEAVKTAGFDSLTFLVLVGASLGQLNNNRYIQIKLQHSDDQNANFVDCTDDEIVSNEQNHGNIIELKAAPDINTRFMMGYIGAKNYVRSVITVTDNFGNDGVIIGIAALLHNPKYKPVGIN
ncbi:hypothetical protein [Rickettsia endosymbiont of Halotydeus destructor]|uniref:hypothetical protein n=1 Tax=Rickettsia endosymbiont of Halotydeus destructor TaxID=2996754 RepID=UPI003BAE909B